VANRLLWSAAALLAGAVAIVAFLLARSTSPSTPRGVPVAQDAGATWPARTRPAPDFRLVDQDGRRISISRFRGRRPVLVTFIDPLCRTYCPLEARRLNGVIRRFPAATRPAVVAVSVNVAGNGRANLRTVGEKWDLVPQWRWAIGSEAQLAQVWKDYHVGVLVQTKRIAGVTVRDVVHTEAAYLVDADGYERALFLWPYSADAVERALRGLTASS
jgi:protein SCO1/2